VSGDSWVRSRPIVAITWIEAALQSSLGELLVASASAA
jgi:hypothetical protein